MIDEQEATLTTKAGDYKIEVKTDGTRHSVVVTCNGAILAAILNQSIPRGFLYEPPYTRKTPRSRSDE